MKRIKWTLIALLSLVLCPFLAYAHSIDGAGAWQRDLAVLTNAEKVRSLQGLLGIPLSKAPFLKDPQTILSLQAALVERSSTLRDQRRERGGVDSGGGGNLVVLKNGELQLLDLYLDLRTSKSDSRPSIRIPESLALKSWGIDRLALRDFAPEQFFASKIARWEKSSPFMVGLLKQALKNIPIYIVDHDFAAKDPHYFLPENFDMQTIQKIVTAAIYVQDFGVFVSRKYFESLDFENQMGLLLHESLRHIQITYGFNNSDKSLQKLTAALMRGPVGAETLDSQEYLDGDLLLSVLEEAKFEITAIQVLTESCQAYQALFVRPCPVQHITLDEVDAFGRKFEEYISDSTQPPAKRRWAYQKAVVLWVFVQTLAGRGIEPTILSIKDAGNALAKTTSMNAIDVISQDFNKHGYSASSYKSEAREVLQGLKAAGLIR